MVYQYGLKVLEKSLNALQRQLEKWLAKDPKNKMKKLYAIFLRSLAVLMAFFAAPEAFARAIAVFGNPFIRHFLRTVRFLMRFALIIGLFFGLASLSLA